MKTEHDDYNIDRNSRVAQEDVYSRSLKDIARQIAVLIVRQHRRRKSSNGKKQSKWRYITLDGNSPA